MTRNETLRERWNRSAKTIPDFKEPSSYAIEKEALFPRHARVCDLGSGAGTDSLYFVSKGHSVDLVDISDYALRLVSQRAKRLGVAGQIQTHEVDFTLGMLPLPDRRYDAVYSRLALHYFPADTMEKLLSEVYRILKPGGVAFITLKAVDDAHEMNYLKRTAKEIEPGVYLDGVVTKARFTISQLETIARSAGIPSDNITVQLAEENLSGRRDKIKSGAEKLVLNELEIHKSQPR